MTPTAQMADIVVPASSWLERDNLISSFQVCPTYTIAEQKAVEVAEARSDVDIAAPLPGNSAWENTSGAMRGSSIDSLIKPTGLTFKEFKAKKRIFAPSSTGFTKRSGFNNPFGES